MYRNESATSVGLPPPSSRGGRRVTRAVNVASSFLFRFSDAGLGSDSGPGPGPGPPPGVQPPSSSSLLPAPPLYAKLAKLPRLDVAADGTPRASRSAPPRRACGAPAGETAARGVWRMSSPLRREAERSWSFASLAPRRCLARSRSFFLRASLSRSDWIFRITCGSTAGAGEGSRSSGTSPRPRRPARRERDRERERGSRCRPRDRRPLFAARACFVGSRPGGLVRGAAGVATALVQVAARGPPERHAVKLILLDHVVIIGCPRPVPRRPGPVAPGSHVSPPFETRAGTASRGIRRGPRARPGIDDGSGRRTRREDALDASRARAGLRDPRGSARPVVPTSAGPLARPPTGD